MPLNESVVMALGSMGILAEKLELKDFKSYAKLVSDAYEAAPAMEPGVEGAWHTLIAHFKKLYKQISSKYKIEFVAEDPYPDAETMQREVKKSGVFKVYTGHNEHPVFTPQENLYFRAVHDYFTHIIANQPFGLRGEIRAYNTHAKLCPPAALPALFTEIVGQACVAVVTGKFPEQKIAILKGFDYKNLGKVEGHEVVNKELVKKPEPQQAAQPVQTGQAPPPPNNTQPAPQPIFQANATPQ